MLRDRPGPLKCDVCNRVVPEEEWLKGKSWTTPNGYTVFICSDCLGKMERDEDMYIWRNE